MGGISVARDYPEAARVVLERSFRKANGCLEFSGAKDRHGYGRIRARGKTVGAHRVVYLAVAPIPARMVVMHSCDNPACVEIEHLGIGTPAENTSDSIKKGRFRIPQPEFSESDVAMIRGGKLPFALAHETLGISESHYYRIKNGESRSGRTMDGSRGE